MTKEKFSRELRLLTPDNFNKVFETPIRASSPCFTLLANNQEQKSSRLGLIVPKKAVKKAVSRNRIKRIIRENFRKNQIKYPPLDIIFIAKSDITTLNNKQISELFLKLWKIICHRYKKSVAS